MKIEDVIRVAYNKVKRSFSESVYYANIFSHEYGTIEQSKHYMQVTFVNALWIEVCRLAKKRRAGKHNKPPYSIDDYWTLVSNLSYESDRYTHNLTGKLVISLKLPTLTFYIEEEEAGLNGYTPSGNHINISSLPPEDTIMYMIGISELRLHLKYQIDELYVILHAKRLSNMILLQSAESIISCIEKSNDIRVGISIDKNGLVLCVVTQNDYPYPPYHKSCRSTLQTLHKDVLETIDKVSRYRFRGYIEDV